MVDFTFHVLVQWDKSCVLTLRPGPGPDQKEMERLRVKNGLYGTVGVLIMCLHGDLYPECAHRTFHTLWWVDLGLLLSAHQVT